MNLKAEHGGYSGLSGGGREQTAGKQEAGKQGSRLMSEKGEEVLVRQQERKSSPLSVCPEAELGRAGMYRIINGLDLAGGTGCCGASVNSGLWIAIRP